MAQANVRYRSSELPLPGKQCCESSPCDWSPDLEPYPYKSLPDTPKDDASQAQVHVIKSQK